jgi:hypothetical protein
MIKQIMKVEVLIGFALVGLLVFIIATATLGWKLTDSPQTQPQAQAQHIIAETRGYPPEILALEKEYNLPLRYIMGREAYITFGVETHYLVAEKNAPNGQWIVGVLGDSMADAIQKFKEQYSTVMQLPDKEEERRLAMRKRQQRARAWDSSHAEKGMVNGH